MRGHYFTILCVLLLVVCVYSMVKQVMAKVKGILVRAKITGYQTESGKQFAQYMIEHEGETILVSDAIADENPGTEEYREVYWVPGDKKYAYRPENAKPMLWQIVGCAAALAVIVIDAIRTFGA